VIHLILNRIEESDTEIYNRYTRANCCGNVRTQASGAGALLLGVRAAHELYQISPQDHSSEKDLHQFPQIHSVEDKAPGRKEGVENPLHSGTDENFLVRLDQLSFELIGGHPDGLVHAVHAVIALPAFV
jgi:hypothetical protein